ncbi:hypothetical protein U9M48_020449 [Paspalum notatum var. saurae]|uniref:STAS domain-containing protein n=1 Tax=Paspalum notatum var. saurae TaxID=547442 RepID=A0AAQ3WS94_PASNO
MGKEGSAAERTTRERIRGGEYEESTDWQRGAAAAAGRRSRWGRVARAWRSSRAVCPPRHPTASSLHSRPGAPTAPPQTPRLCRPRRHTPRSLQPRASPRHRGSTTRTPPRGPARTRDVALARRLDSTTTKPCRLTRDATPPAPRPPPSHLADAEAGLEKDGATSPGQTLLRRRGVRSGTWVETSSAGGEGEQPALEEEAGSVGGSILLFIPLSRGCDQNEDLTVIKISGSHGGSTTRRNAPRPIPMPRWAPRDRTMHEASSVFLLATAVRTIDLSGTRMMDELMKSLDRRGIQIVQTNSRSEIMKKLDSSRLLELIGQSGSS